MGRENSSRLDARSQQLLVAGDDGDVGGNRMPGKEADIQPPASTQP